MIKDIQLRMLPNDAANSTRIEQKALLELGVTKKHLSGFRVYRKSVDARQRIVYINLAVRCFIDEPYCDAELNPIIYKDVSAAKSIVIVGAGPAGLFAALRLIEGGLRPIVLERGETVEQRRKDIAEMSRSGEVNSASNYSFGEGGAGAFSDGKLFTRSKKRGSIDKILQLFCQFGANRDILVNVHPHIGTDKLPHIIAAMRNKIIECGGEVHFNTLVNKFLYKDSETICGVTTKEGKEFVAPVILATGHSARDIYQLLYTDKIEMEPKGLAVGVRLEHPQELINQIQYHSEDGKGDYLPTAEYNYVTQVKKRGVYSFCMCPGGIIVPAATGEKQVVVNGMSSSMRNSPWSNSGMVVEIRPEDIMKEANDVLAMMHFQEKLESDAWVNSGAGLQAPGQRMSDFVNKRNSYDLPSSSYVPGLIASPLHFLMPDFVADPLREGLKHFGKCAHGFLTNEALMIGVETRTSSPVRLLRDRFSLQHIRVKGLFPCGEGAGYAGGIVSSAIDGQRVAEAILMLEE